MITSVCLSYNHSSFIHNISYLQCYINNKGKASVIFERVLCHICTNNIKWCYKIQNNHVHWSIVQSHHWKCSFIGNLKLLRPACAEGKQITELYLKSQSCENLIFHIWIASAVICLSIFQWKASGSQWRNIFNYVTRFKVWIVHKGKILL